MFRLISYSRLSGAAAVLVLLPLAPHLPALASLAALALGVAVLNGIEPLRVENSGWRTRLSKRSP